MTLRSSALSLQAIRVEGSKGGASWSKGVGILGRLFGGQKRLDGLLSRVPGLVEETD